MSQNLLLSFRGSHIFEQPEIHNVKVMWERSRLHGDFVILVLIPEMEIDECKAMKVLMEAESLLQVRDELDSLPNIILSSIANKCLDHFILTNYAGFFGNVFPVIRSLGIN